MALADVRRLHDEAAASYVVTLASSTRAPSGRIRIRSWPSSPATRRRWRRLEAPPRQPTMWRQGKCGRSHHSPASTATAFCPWFGTPTNFYAHLHAYILPDDLRASRLHPGVEAERAVVVSGPRESEDAKTPVGGAMPTRPRCAKGSIRIGGMSACRQA